MKLGLGLLSGQRSPDDERTWTDLYREMLVLAEDADAVGLDSIWTTEHHFVDDGYMPSLLVTSAAIAARTTRIKIATGVLLAPLHDPLRLAEDAATVQLISQGRLVLGLGLGWSPTEFEALGFDKSKRGRAMDEIIPILRQAWTGDPIEHRGEVYDLRPVAVRPTPGTPIPIVIGGGAEKAIRRAARLADGFYTSNASVEGVKRQVGWAHDEMDRIGRNRASFDWSVWRYVWLCDDRDAAWEEILPHLNATRWKYSDMEASATRPLGPIPTAPPPDEKTVASLRRQVLLGTPDQVAAEVAEMRTAVGIPFDLSARSVFPGMDLERQREQIQRLGNELAPRLADL